MSRGDRSSLISDYQIDDLKLPSLDEWKKKLLFTFLLQTGAYET